MLQGGCRRSIMTEVDETQDPGEGMDLSGNGTRFWFVVQTKPGNEERVKTNLLNQEIESFLPMVKTYQYRAGKMLERIRPLFPSYLFANMDLDAHFYRVKWTRGVNKILGGRSGPIPVAHKVVETIKRRIGEDNLIELQNDLKDGDAIQVTSGPLKDLIGIFRTEMSSKGRVKVLLSLIGVDVPVQISRWQIKKV
jgi:transcription elongation factor/antiterminator RfaH